MKKLLSIMAVMVLTASMLTMVSCGKSELTGERYDPSAYKVQGPGLRTEERGRRPPHTVLQRIQTAVLLQNYRRNR